MLRFSLRKFNLAVYKNWVKKRATDFVKIPETAKELDRKEVFYRRNSKGENLSNYYVIWNEKEVPVLKEWIEEVEE